MGTLIAIISGALMSIQGVFNTGVTKQTSIWVAAAFVQFTALIVCLAAWFLTGRDSNFAELFRIDNKYMLLGGVIGAFITFSVIKSIDLLSPARAIIIIVVSQLLLAYLIEMFGMFGVERAEFEIKRVVGIVLAVLGIIIFKM